MDIDGALCNSLPHIETHILNFYKSLFDSTTPMLATLEYEF
jgi:hypothetical protein